MIQHLRSPEEFEAFLAKGNVVVDFFASWCGPCRMMGRVLEEIEADYPSLVFLKVDVDKFPQIAQRYGVMSIPSFVAYRDGSNVPFSFNGAKQTVLVGGMQEDDFKLLLNETFQL